MHYFKSNLLLLLVAGLICITLIAGHVFSGENTRLTASPVYWNPPDVSAIPENAEGELIRYGRDLVISTSYYLGPKGTVAAKKSNGMNCQNCHLDAGTRFWGNNFGGTAATYPKYRDRSGAIETIYKRVNDCMERSLNGEALDTNSREMQAIQAYIKWIGRNVPIKMKPVGSAIQDLTFPDRAADTTKGRLVFIRKCQSCHTPEGTGLLNADGTGYVYPPLWGNNSFNTGAGLYRISRLAGYVKDNMPFGSTHEAPGLTVEESWDVSAFIISQPRPVGDIRKDWPDISKKPIDHPFGPYVDTFSELQHKYGPFEPIKLAYQKMMVKKKK
jgi:thiosulfate dehydrogenase